MKYRILMNGNGEFILERKGWFFWYHWSDRATFGGWQDSGFPEKPTLYATSEVACKRLLEIQEQDRRDRKCGQWSVVVRDEAK